MKAFIWHERDSFLHRLNPLTKLGLSVPVVVLVSVTFEPMVPMAIALMALLATLLLGRVPVAKLLSPMGFALVLAFGMFWTGALFYARTGAQLQTSESCFGPACVSSASLVYGAAMGARMLAIFATSLLFVLTTDPAEFVLALIQQCKLPYQIGYAVFAAYRFVPLFQEEFDNIRAAHQMRGVSSHGGLSGRAREFLGFAIPLMAIAVRKGERLALAMDSRAFGALQQRTYYRVTTLGRNDALFAAGALAALVAVMLLL